MKYWFVIHDLLAYRQHQYMIGNKVKAPRMKWPKSPSFADIGKGDLIVYYATRDYVVVGVFEAVSEMEYLSDDPHWKEIMVYRIRPVELPPLGNYLDFKKLVKDPDVSFDMFPKNRNWGRYLQGKTCKLLTEKDYLTIKKAFSQKKYLKNIEKVKVKPTECHVDH